MNKQLQLKVIWDWKTSINKLSSSNDNHFMCL